MVSEKDVQHIAELADIGISSGELGTFTHQFNEILEYFEPAFQLGMTATPKCDVNVNTYAYFGNPVYTYSLRQGIEDGFDLAEAVNLKMRHFEQGHPRKGAHLGGIAGDEPFHGFVSCGILVARGAAPARVGARRQIGSLYAERVANVCRGGRFPHQCGHDANGRGRFQKVATGEMADIVGMHWGGPQGD